MILNAVLFQLEGANLVSSQKKSSLSVGEDFSDEELLK